MEKKNEIVVYQPNETIRLDVRLENETVWLTQLKIAELFGVQKAAISKHVRNIFASGELVRESTVSKMETLQMEGGRYVSRMQEFFNLDVIIAVGYRVNSWRATQFRIWATGILKEYLLRGYSVNSRLNQIEDAMHRNFGVYDQRIATLEGKVDFFVQTQTPPLQVPHRGTSAAPSDWGKRRPAASKKRNFFVLSQSGETPLPPVMCGSSLSRI